MSPSHSETMHARIRAAFDCLLDEPDDLRYAAVEDLGLTAEEEQLLRRLLDGLKQDRLFKRDAAEWVMQLGDVDSEE
jgi:hypothetical protein